jgi:hypothetical protein
VAQAEKAQIIQVPNTLRAKVGGKLGALDPSAITRAEEALASLSDHFESWLDEEIDKLYAAQEHIRQVGYNTETAEALYYRCHDLKGLGTTYGYPLITRMAGSICKMLDDPDQRMLAPKILIDAHLDAIRAVVRDKIKVDTHPVGKILAETLEARVLEHMAKIKG